MTALTVAAWVKSAAAASNQGIVGKGTPLAGGWIFLVNDTTSYDLRLAKGRGTTNLNAVSPTNAVVAGQLSCLAGQFDTAGAASAQKLFTGTLDRPITEISSYATQTAGSGTVGNDSAQSLVLAARHSADSVAFNGQIYAVGLWNTVLTLDQLRAWQNDFYAPLPRCVGLWRPGANGTGLVWDESGFNSHGTITGAIPTNDYLPRVFQRNRLIA